MYPFLIRTPTLPRLCWLRVHDSGSRGFGLHQASILSSGSSLEWSGLCNDAAGHAAKAIHVYAQASYQSMFDMIAAHQ